MLVPAGEGTPTIELTNGSTSHENRIPPQPLAPGAANELSTSLFSLNAMIVNAPDSAANVPGLPLIGLFGAGGEVVPVVRFSVIGLEFEPM